MEKLYKFVNGSKKYWEYWEGDNGSFTIHWGDLGTRGDSKIIKSSLFKSAAKTIAKEVARVRAEGYTTIDREHHATLLIEYLVVGMGTVADVDKRHRLEDRMNNTLGWTGLGHCDGGSIGSGSMEVCCFVVDFDLAKMIIEKDLAGTEFSNYSRIYDENG